MKIEKNGCGLKVWPRGITLPAVVALFYLPGLAHAAVNLPPNPALSLSGGHVVVNEDDHHSAEIPQDDVWDKDQPGNAEIPNEGLRVVGKRNASQPATGEVEVRGEPVLRQFTIDATYIPNCPGTLTVSLEGNDGNVKFWEDEQRTKEFTLEKMHVVNNPTAGKLKFWVEGIKPTEGFDSIKITAVYDVPADGGSGGSAEPKTSTGTLEFGVVRADVDVDTLNKGAAANIESANPGGVDADSVADQKELSLNMEVYGKLLLANRGDEDGDGVQNAADGITDLGAAEAGQTKKFEKVVIHHDKPWSDEASYTFRYEFSEPKEGEGLMEVPVPEGAEGETRWTVVKRGMRLWLKDGDELRTAAEGNDLVHPDKPVTWAALKARASVSDDTTITLFAEYVMPDEGGDTATRQPIEVAVDMDPDANYGKVVVDGQEVTVFNSPDARDAANVTLLPVELAVDSSRDGEITFDLKDKTTAEKPYRFWVNDDQDVETENWKWTDPDPETVPVQTKDYSDTIIQSARDLEDFTRLWISFKGSAEMVKSAGFQLKLEWKPTDGISNWPSDAGNPQIKVYNAVEKDGGRKYIEDEAIATQQNEEPYNTMAADVPRGSAVVLPLSQVTKANLTEASPYVYLLFEGASEGKGQIVLSLHKDGEKIGECPPLFLDIKNIKKMYVRGHTTPLPADFPFPYDQGNPPAAPYVATQSGGLLIPYQDLDYGLGNGEEAANNQAFDKPPDEEKKCIIFVHGIDMNLDYYHSYSESCFKRLWWEGYKGRLAAFRWGTPLSTEDGPDIFNDGEMRAWSYGPSLIAFEEYMAGQVGSGTRVSIIGHSLGNAVVGSAFQQGLVVDSYIAMEAAVSLSCYFAPPAQGQADTLPAFGPLATAEVAKPTPHYHTALGYRGYLKDLTQGISGNFVNYHNRNDFWLATGKTADPPPVWVPVPPLPIPILVDLPPQDVHWIKNQIDYKPNDLVGPGEYKFYPNNGAGNQVRFEKIFNNDRPVEDPHESMAYVARSRTRALGAEPADGNPAPPGAQEVDLNVEYGFDRPRPHHSGQFQLNIQEMYQSDGTRFTKPLYRRMLEDLRVQPQ